MTTSYTLPVTSRHDTVSVCNCFVSRKRRNHHGNICVFSHAHLSKATPRHSTGRISDMRKVHRATTSGLKTSGLMRDPTPFVTSRKEQSRRLIHSAFCVGVQRKSGNNGVDFRKFADGIKGDGLSYTAPR